MSKFFQASCMFSLLALINSPLGQQLANQGPKEELQAQTVKQATRLYSIEEINEMAAARKLEEQNQEQQTLSYETLLAQAQNAKKHGTSQFSQNHIAAITENSAQQAQQMGALGGVLGVVSKVFGTSTPTSGNDVQNSFAQAQAEAQYILSSGDTQRFADMIDQHAGFLTLLGQNPDQSK